MYNLKVDSFSTFLKVAKNTQEDISKFSRTLYHILKHYSSKPVFHSISGEDHRIVRVLVSLRTDLTNEILVPTEGNFYTEFSEPRKTPVLLDDLVLLSAHDFVLRYLRCEEDLADVILKHSALWVAGACVYDEQIYVYVNVVMDHKTKNMSNVNLVSSDYVPISTLKAYNNLEDELIANLTITKGDVTNDT